MKEKIVKGFVCIVLFMLPSLLMQIIETEAITEYKTWELAVGYASVIILIISHGVVCAAIFKAWTEQ